MRECSEWQSSVNAEGGLDKIRTWLAAQMPEDAVFGNVGLGIAILPARNAQATHK